jgi:hypothetical protein
LNEFDALAHSRSVHGTDENAVMIPPLGKTALVWGLFLGVSANIRYQVRITALDTACDVTRVLFLLSGSAAVVMSFINSLHYCGHSQIVFGIERLVDMTIAKRVPQVAYATTVAVRFCNNVIGELKERCESKWVSNEWTYCEITVHVYDLNFIHTPGS